MSLSAGTVHRQVQPRHVMRAPHTQRKREREVNGRECDGEVHIRLQRFWQRRQQRGSAPNQPNKRRVHKLEERRRGVERVKSRAPRVSASSGVRINNGRAGSAPSR